ncbi:Cas10/Cmr2 second palm domain-containing protein [uncultured Thermomonospora sp.]|uniref:Cas10/Cmr2 second palm domain-containing protein n=1 Tax=uncultured Thermomonospora sp. TaxID=671175 RepID=UPI00259B12C1|nr:hypothetical protein [uncultured Thermomonospora sp.]
MKVHVVVVATSGNQRFIFASNKRRENVGASYLITRVEEKWLTEALENVAEHRVEIVTANAGGITALVHDPEVGRELVGQITLRALREAPGLDVCGAVGEAAEWDELDAAALAELIRRTRELLPKAQMSRPGPQLRFPGVPIAARCLSSGLPAAWIARPTPLERPEPRSAPSMAKLKAFPEALGRLVEKMGLNGPDREGARQRLARVVDWLNFKAEWVAVVHADGNGMGRIFQEFAAIVTAAKPNGERPTAEEYVQRLRAFSEGVDACAAEALRRTVAALKNDGAYRLIDGEVPLLPLVLGGDDLTVVCDGSIALPFAERYLTEFTHLARENEDVGGLLRRAKHPGLGACAGVAIVKRHYPFHNAVALAEELTKEAKSVKALGQDRCALSFHVLHESAVARLARLREEMTLPDGTRLTAQPYVVGEVGADPRGWARHRHWTDLRRRIAALTCTDEDGRRVLSGAQAHDLRAGLFHGPDVADARYRLLTHRIGDGADGVAGASGSLFWEFEGRKFTGLLDAMNAVGFLPGSEHTEQERPA